MKHIQAQGNTLPDAYHEALLSLFLRGDKVPCPAYGTKCLEASATILVRTPLGEPMISRFFPGGAADLQQYTMEMLDGILDFEVDRGNWEYTYHRRMTDYGGRDQLRFVVDELRRDPCSRRAVVTVRRPEDDMGSDDPACLQMLQYMIRDGKLDCFATFRSNDALEATFMNAYALIRLQERLARELGVGVGSYTHHANSFHVYEKDFNRLSGLVENRLYHHPGSSDNCYRYEGDWDKEMSAAIPDILKKVEELKNK